MVGQSEVLTLHGHNILRIGHWPCVRGEREECGGCLTLCSAQLRWRIDGVYRERNRVEEGDTPSLGVPKSRGGGVPGGSPRGTTVEVKRDQRRSECWSHPNEFVFRLIVTERNLRSHSEVQYVLRRSGVRSETVEVELFGEPLSFRRKEGRTHVNDRDGPFEEG